MRKVTSKLFSAATTHHQLGIPEPDEWNSKPTDVFSSRRLAKNKQFFKVFHYRKVKTK